MVDPVTFKAGINTFIRGNPDKMGLIEGTKTVRGVKCKTFGSWEGMKDWFKEHPGETDPCLILQETHGEKGGASYCDQAMIAKAPTATDILGIVKNEAKNRPVSVVLDSCHSGDVMTENLAQDAKNPGDTAIDHLCLVTSSVPGRIVYDPDIDFAARLTTLPAGKTTSMNEFFLGSKEGMISSAEWEGSGLANFLRQRQTLQKDGKLAATMIDLQGALRESALHCNDPAKKSAANFCFSSSADDFIFEKLANPSLYAERYDDFFQKELNTLTPAEFRSFILRRDWKLGPDETEFGVYSPNFAEIQKKEFAAATTYIQKPYSPFYSCLNAWIDFLNAPERVAEFKKKKQILTPELSRLWANFEKQHPDCDEMRTIDTLLQGLDPGTEAAKLLMRIRLHDKNAPEFYAKQNQFRKESAQASGEKAELAASLAGMSTLKYENGRDERTPSCRAPASMGRAIQAFVYGSLEKMKKDPKSYVNPLDQRRHKACQNFVF